MTNKYPEIVKFLGKQYLSETLVGQSQNYAINFNAIYRIVGWYRHCNKKVHEILQSSKKLFIKLVGLYLNIVPEMSVFA